jgi:WD40 repeat protein
MGRCTSRPPGAEWQAVAAHDGAVLSAVADVRDGFLTAAMTGGWCGWHRMAGSPCSPTIRGNGWTMWRRMRRGCAPASVGKALHLMDGAGGALKTLVHPTSVGGIAFDAKGKRVAASHYNGCSLWFVAAKEDKPRLLEWKGSHHGIAFSPDGTHVVTAMQEPSLHGWRLTDGQHMRMSGYPSKTRSLSFTARGRWLATSGAESVVLWPFFGGGPMGKAPTELAGGDEVLCSAVACHPSMRWWPRASATGWC